MNWEKGRKGTGYLKKLLVSWTWPIPWDLYILKYPVGSFVGWHKDPVKDGKHYRMNLVIPWTCDGGSFLCEFGTPPIYRSEYLNIFRPDITKHSVSYIHSGTRYVISLGWVIKT